MTDEDTNSILANNANNDVVADAGDVEDQPKACRLRLHKVT